MAKENNLGIVYVLSNRAMPGLVKIGMTTRPELDARLKELYTTGVPVPFDVEYACEVKACNCAKLEKALHKAFEPNRLNVNREFFQIKKEQAIAILEIFNEKEITTEVSDEMNNDLNADDIASKSKATKHTRAKYSVVFVVDNAIPQRGFIKTTMNLGEQTIPCYKHTTSN